jgi:hypothetical protein
MTKITENTNVIKNQSLIESEIDGEKVMMSLESGDYFGLDSIGTDIWKLIENSIKVSDLIDILVTAYDVSREKCSEDVINFLNQLYAHNLIIIE